MAYPPPGPGYAPGYPPTNAPGYPPSGGAYPPPPRNTQVRIVLHAICVVNLKCCVVVALSFDKLMYIYC